MPKQQQVAPEQFYINMWRTGLYTQRSPLITPVASQGMQVVSRFDALVDGLNMELSNNNTLVRRPAFPRYCSVQLGANDYPLNYYSFTNLSGVLKLVVDTPTYVHTFTSSTLTPILTKGTTAQTRFQKVANMLYMCNGVDLKKWDGTTTTNWGIAAAVTAPTLAFVANGVLSPTSGYRYVYVGKNSTTGHTSTASPISASTGPLRSNNVTESTSVSNITAVAISGSNVVTITCVNNFKPGQTVLINNLVTATSLNGVTLTVTTSSTVQFTAPFTHALYTTTADTGTATMKVTVPNAPYMYVVKQGNTFIADAGVVYSATNVSLALTTGVPTTGQYSVNVATGTYTFAAADVGLGVVPSYSYSLALSTGLNISITGSGFTDTQVDKIDVFRTNDGGSVFNYLATVSNPGAGTWTYTDSTVDSGLNDFIHPSMNHLNDPPPAGATDVKFHMGRIWVAVNNFVYFGAGGDTLSGVPEEAFPPANVFEFPAKVTAIFSHSVGLMVLTSDNIYIISGGDTLSFSDKLWMANFGVKSPNCVAQDGDLFYVYTSRGQLFEIGDSLSEIGQPIGDQLQLKFNPNTTCLALHRSGSDAGLFISDGTTNLYKYSLAYQAWSTTAQPVGGVNIVSSIEATTANWTLMSGRAVGGQYLTSRNLTSYTDDGGTYPAFATIGTLTVAPPGETLGIDSVLVERMPVGSPHTVSVLLNEIGGTFTVVPFTAVDPWSLPGSTSIIATRHDLTGAAIPLPQMIRHLQVKISFVSEAIKNEVLGLALKPL
jgi:hypothetical protein